MSTIPPVLDRVKALGYPVFVNGDWNLNITGLRCPERVANAFDDRICVSFKVGDIWRTETYEATCDPGSPFLLKPINNAGCAILAPGFYRGAYSIGLHRGKYKALVQSGPVTVYRDDNRNNILDMDAETVQTGYFGINIHKRDAESDTVNGASAGCQVFRYERDFDRFMYLCNQQVEVRGFKTFSYCLIDE